MISEPPSMDWLDDSKTILYTKVSNWNWQDLNRVAMEGYALQETVTHGTYVIWDVSDSVGTLPEGAIRHIRELVDTAHPNDRLIIIVGASEIIRILVTTVGRIYRFAAIIQNYRFVNTLNQALTLIQVHKQETQEQFPQ